MTEKSFVQPKMSRMCLFFIVESLPKRSSRPLAGEAASSEGDAQDILYLSPEDMKEAKKSMKEKGIKAEDVKNLPPIEEIH